MSSNQRQWVVAANWKMHKSPSEARHFVDHFVPALVRQNGLRADGSAQAAQKAHVVIFAPPVDLAAVVEAAADRDARQFGVFCGAQNVYFETKGAFTGETSPQVLSEMSVTHALVGHSERRSIFHETDQDTAKKVATLQRVGLTPMLCVGETLAEREAGQTDAVIVRQLELGLSQWLSETASLAPIERRLIVAYEPVWAIGTGRVATAEQANQAHQALRTALMRLGGDALGQTSILYGGSVKPDNASELAAQAEIDGFLVGGASLEVESFLRLCADFRRAAL